MHPSTPFAAWLKSRRKAADLTQEELARAVGCSIITIVKLEAGQRRPSRQIAARLAACLGVPESEQAAFVHFARTARETPAGLAPALAGGAAGSNGVALPYLRPPAHNLPAPPNALIGRARELAAVTALLRRPGVRLLTLVGPPGIGKTRLAVAAAAPLVPRYADGVVFVSLGPIQAAHLVAPTIARACVLRDAADRAVAAQLADYLRARATLLLLDNFEQVVDAAPLVADLLASAPHLQVLVTSREPLHLYGEYEFRVPPLSLPATPSDALDAPGDPRAWDASALFVERALAVAGDFAWTTATAPAVLAVCRQLDGLPLAVELAAARLRVRSLDEIAARLTHGPPAERLGLLVGETRNAPTRQRTLRDAIAWSYDLLDSGEQHTFRYLGVFAGGCDVVAVRAVVGAPALDSLVGKNLLQQTTGACGEPRYEMLATIRDYAVEQLSAHGEAALAGQAHAEYYLGLAEQGDAALHGPEQGAWLARLDQEQANFRRAFDWADETGATTLALRLAAALGLFWYTRGNLHEGFARLEHALAAAPDADSLLRAKALNAGGPLALSRGAPGPARAFYAESLALYAAAGDGEGQANALYGLGFLHMRAAEYAAAHACCTASLEHARACDFTPGIARALFALGTNAASQGQVAAARPLLEESLNLYRRLQNKGSIGTVLEMLGDVTMSQGDYAAAEDLFAQSLAVGLELRDPVHVASVLVSLGNIAAARGDYASARAHAEESLALWRQIGDNWPVALVLNNLALVYLHEGRTAAALACGRESLVLADQLGARAQAARALANLAIIAATTDSPAAAARLFGAAAAALNAAGISLQNPELADYDRALAGVHVALDPPTFAAAWAAGQALVWPEALAVALAATDDGR